MQPLSAISVRRILLVLSFGTLVTGCSLPKPPPPGGSKNRAFIIYKPAPANSGEITLAVKDLIDVKGMVTSAGSEHLSKTSPPAKQDAECLEIARERGVRIVGKTNLSEFAMGTTGMNEYFGTPRNPLDKFWKHIIPGGSSSGSGVAVATDMADIALGTDTAGSIRVPAACNGIYGLKTTFGLVSTKGVFPVSPKYLDTVGPMAKDIKRMVLGMDLLQRGFKSQYEKAVAAQPKASNIRIGRLYLKGTHPGIDEAIDARLKAEGFQIVVLDKAFEEKWHQAHKDGDTIAVVDAWLHNKKYEKVTGVSLVTKAAMLLGDIEYPKGYEEALQRRAQWRKDLRRVLQQVDFIALPTLQKLPPRIPFVGRSAIFEAEVLATQNTVAVNYAGNPALAIPVAMPGKNSFPTSLQLVGSLKSEAKLLNAGRIFESQDG